MPPPAERYEPEDEDVIDADAVEYAAEIPSKLYAVVADLYDRLQSAHIERKIGDTWRSTRKRFAYGQPPPTQTVEDICSQCVDVVTDLTEKAGRDSRFRVLLTYTDTTKSTGIGRRGVPIEAEIMEDGQVVVRDASELGERDHLSILNSVIEKQDTRMDDLFGRVMEMMDKNNEASDRQIEQAGTYAKGIATVGDSLSGIVTTVMQVLEQATRITQEKEKEHVAVQLAKMDAEAEQAKMKALLMLLAKVGGPIAAQISKVIGGGTVTPAVAAVAQRPALAKPAAPAAAATAVASKVAAAADITTEEPTAEPTSCDRLTVWLAGLEETTALQVQEIIGADHFVAFVEASESKSAETADKTLAAFKAAIDLEVKEDAEAVAEKMAKLGEVLGNDATEAFAKMLPD